MLPSNLSLINRHRAAFPGTGFIAINGERMSDRDDTRLWDMLWRSFKVRNAPVMKRPSWDIWNEEERVPDYDESRKAARMALSRLSSWYRVPSSPHCAFSEVY